MAFLSAEDIFNADDRPTEVVKVPEWNGEVRIRTLSGLERDKWEESMVQTRKGNRELNLKNARAKLVQMCAVDEDGNQLFKGDIALVKLGNKSSLALTRVFEACQKLNGMTDEDVEELTEGFEDDPDESDSSD